MLNGVKYRKRDCHGKSTKTIEEPINIHVSNSLL